MSTELFEFEGIASWARVFEQNRDMDKRFHGDYDGLCSIDLEMDKEEYDKFIATGSRTSGKPGENGIIVKFKRKFAHAFAGGAPKVAKADGTLWKLEEDGLIGNGSRVKVFATVYDTKIGKGTRLEGVQVLEHVPFESERKESTGIKLPFEE
jgi:hypothetical protein